VRPAAGVRSVLLAAPSGDPVEAELARAFGRAAASRLRAGAVAPLLDLVRDAGRVYRYRTMLVVMTPESVWTEQQPVSPAELARWAERILAISERLYPPV
jgi:hypothetical protein